MKKIYLFNEKGFYTGDSFAQESPLELGVYLMPTNSTEIPPKLAVKKMPKFFDGVWNLVDNLVGERFWLENGGEFAIREIGESFPPTALFIPPPAVIANARNNIEVSAFQAKASLARFNMYETVQALMGNPQTPIEMRLAWENAQSFKRMSPTVLAMGNLMNLNENDLDALFELASSITA